MPNRGELPTRRQPQSKAAVPNDNAWAVIGFCTIGLAISVYAAVSSLGIDSVPRAVSQFYLGF
jgi:hypothetical protein